MLNIMPLYKLAAGGYVGHLMAAGLRRVNNELPTCFFWTEGQGRAVDLSPGGKLIREGCHTAER